MYIRYELQTPYSIRQLQHLKLIICIKVAAETPLQLAGKKHLIEKQDATQERLGRKRCQLQFGIMIFVNLELGHDLDLQIILIQVDPMIT